MIFVTVGTQLPFDRLLRAVDAWAQRTGRGDVFAQIGPTEYEPTAIDWRRDLEPEEFTGRLREAELIIAHAGMGTIINALRAGTPLLVMPRRADLGEHRNDHQLATVRELGARGLVHVAADEHELDRMLEGVGDLAPLPGLPEFANQDLIDHVRAFVFGA